MELSNFILEKDFAQQGYTHIIGTDEVGRGPLCGPVVAAAVCFKCADFPEPSFKSELSSIESKKWDLVRDSKTLSEKQREEIFDFIGEHFHVGIGLCDHETIDRINILEASFLSMKKAVQELQRIMNQESRIKNENSNSIIHDSKFLILVDGNKEIPNFSFEQYAVIGGDKICKSISAASIVAKVTRDRIMMSMHQKYPNYGLDKHKGYGTKLHMEALEQFGPCAIHRKSFGPVKKSLRQA